MNTGDETMLRKQMTDFGASLFARGLAVGGAGNMSARLPDGNLLVTPTNASFGRLDAGRLSKVDLDGNLLSGDPPTKESSFHRRLYREKPDCGAVVHLHSTWLTALSCLEGLNPDNVLRAFTPYYVMKVGKLSLIPYYRPGHPKLADELAARAGGGNAFLLANHGPVVTGKDLEAAVNAAEELEETAKLFFALGDRKIRYLSDAETAELR